MSSLANRLLTVIGSEAFRVRTRNVGHLLSGNAVTLVLGLVAVALTARALGPADFGQLALMVTFAQAMELLISFQTWQPMIRYGAGLNDEHDADALGALFKFGFVLDMSAAFASWLLAVVILFLAGHFYDWSNPTYGLVLIYISSLLFRLHDTPTGILRLAGRFRSIAYLQVVSTAIKLVFCVVAYLAGAGLFEFVLIWTGTQILGSILLLAAALYELARRGLNRIHRASLKGIGMRFPEIWKFIWSTNLSLTAWSSAQQLDTLLVGALADPAGAGLFHIAKRVGRAMYQAGAQVQAVVYPEIARHWNAKALHEFRNVVLQTEIMLAGFGLALFAAMLFVAEPLMVILAGPDFVAAAPLLTVQVFAVVLMLSASVKRAALLSMGKARSLFLAVLVVVPVFHATAIVLIPRIGPMGASIAHVAMGLVWIGILSVMLRKGLREAFSGKSALSDQLHRLPD
ncbi:lipopolysaccharide biosynthesis protein [Altererythrobacter sp. Root672]|uniref:lipopolysaccharide biosynthesis protein n=1 Tax=Altererythrobacter sp. Root672 TaxID=1736584 RepID=UPI0007010146|nr:oligosaccharide flippase family protein [Altererythrobacter sp. Root672]KRA79731.1 hypothetical protein ASD76_17065 [Altererythrobacter sp. Root672]